MNQLRLLGGTMNNKVKFSVRIHQGGYSYQSLRRIWIEADRLEYYSATLYGLLNVPALECWTTLSALVAETSWIRLTPPVLANTYRHQANSGLTRRPPPAPDVGAQLAQEQSGTIVPHPHHGNQGQVKGPHQSPVQPPFQRSDKQFQ